MSIPKTSKEKAIEILKTIMDPEIGLDLWTLGLIYNVDTDDELETVNIRMTFTTPFCPFGPQMIGEIKASMFASGFRAAEVEVTFDPPWEPNEELRELLGV